MVINIIGCVLFGFAAGHLGYVNNGWRGAALYWAYGFGLYLMIFSAIKG